MIDGRWHCTQGTDLYRCGQPILLDVLYSREGWNGGGQ